MKVAIVGYGEYDVFSISYGTDSFGEPIDISIIATKEVVEDLASKGLIGNYNEDSIVDTHTGKYYWETLSARLPPFRVLNAKCSRFYPMEHPKLHCIITHQDL